MALTLMVGVYLMNRIYQKHEGVSSQADLQKDHGFRSLSSSPSPVLSLVSLEMLGVAPPSAL